MTLAIRAPDVMGDLRAFLRSQPDLHALHNGRVFFRMPDPAKLSGFPVLRLYRVGGGPNPSLDYDPLWTMHVAVETWGNELKMYDKVRQTVDVLESVAASLVAGPLNPPSGTTYARSAWVTTSLDAPDPDTGWPRFVSDFVIVASRL